MAFLENTVKETIKLIEELHDLCSRVKWSELNREGFLFELERSTKKLNVIYSKLSEIDKSIKMLLEKNSPDLSGFLVELSREITVLESNISMEKSKKFHSEMVNEIEKKEVPELYSSLQQKILGLSLKTRYNIEKVNNFLAAKNMPFVKKGNTAKNLIELLQRKEDELGILRQRNVDLKRKSFFGTVEEKSIAEIEFDLHEKDKTLKEAVTETSKALKTHLAQINYVEGSFANLSERVKQIEDLHENYSKKTLELIKEMKKERDYARVMALEIEQETLKIRSEYTKEILEIEDKKNTFKEKVSERYVKEIDYLKKELNDKSVALANVIKLIEQQEKEIRRLKAKLSEEKESTQNKGRKKK